MGPDTAHYEFECPNCHEQLIVDPPVQRDLLRSGCPVCEGAVSRRDFRRER